jgi:hypothetical protein
LVSDNSKVVQEGTALYDNAVQYGVRITKSSIWYGSGDYEDPPEIRQDREVECYYVWFESLTERGRFNAGGGACLTLAEAKSQVEKLTYGTVRWQQAARQSEHQGERRQQGDPEMK